MVQPLLSFFCQKVQPLLSCGHNDSALSWSTRAAAKPCVLWLHAQLVNLGAMKLKKVVMAQTTR